MWHKRCIDFQRVGVFVGDPGRLTHYSASQKRLPSTGLVVLTVLFLLFVVAKAHTQMTMLPRSVTYVVVSVFTVISLPG
jgi:hypothetical protein